MSARTPRKDEIVTLTFLELVAAIIWSEQRGILSKMLEDADIGPEDRDYWMRINTAYFDECAPEVAEIVEQAAKEARKLVRRSLRKRAKKHG